MMINSENIKLFVHIYDIDWDTDDVDDVSLPEEVTHVFTREDDLEDIISDWLSDEYGYCHNGFRFKIKNDEENNDGV